MKTTDLIPIILYQLKDGDRYGYEIIKQIEDSSQGKIAIKQPTLYSVLKKLEQNKFITSYWQDSEIGGKRHYYKLTDNGTSQLSTYPPLQQLIADALDEDIISVANSESISNNISTAVTDSTSTPQFIVDKVAEPMVTPIKIDLTSPTGLVTDDKIQINTETASEIKSIDEMPSSTNIFEVIEPATDIESATSSSINIFDMMEPASDIEFVSSPTSIFDAMDAEESKQQDPVKTDEIDLSINNKQVDYISETETVEDIVSVEPEVEAIDLNSKLTDKLDVNPEIFVNAEDYNREEHNIGEDSYSPIEQIKYLNYVDLSTDEKACSRRKVISKHLQKMICTCSTLLLMFVLTLVICCKYTFGKIYYIGAIASVLVIILYPIILFKDISKLRFKYCTNPFKYSLFQDMFIKLSTFLSLVIATFAYNISATSSIANMFKLTNFANFYAPIIFATIFIFDLMFGMLLYKDYRVKK